MSLRTESMQTYQLETEALVSIYALVDPDTREVRYIGKAIDVERRLRQHLSTFQLSYYKSRKNSWIKSLLDRGLRPDVETLAVVPSAEANEAERHWIARAHELGARLVNGTAGGDGGAITDPEAKARIRAAHVGRKAGDQTRKKMSAARKKRCSDPKERERLSAISNGKPPVHHGEKNPQAKLTDVQVRQLRERAAAGEALLLLAAEYGITAASVTQLVTGQFRRAAGGPIREAKPRSKLNAEDLVEICRLAGDGVTQAEIARRYDVHQSRISQVISGRRTASTKRSPDVHQSGANPS